ncbi:hypothetical protein IQ231_10355 [Cuspidothrix issatschenkoi LEGE 03284]|uniref:hypothetical protein n=1 Tax=Cuspidothrix issatschenkoi TaxID=230752 RepID=UPI00187FA6BA|nr:hypothetical protein [Cuspidothrix issatschenkoi]MBE9232080.1 hypothetical protein [Cuspidothrix issatschenkoi LEGE 03284]
MARAIERIQKDITELEEAVRVIAEELKLSYTKYLNVLGPALQQQLILASYYLCTQGYPEEFLKLSLNQRQKLQQSIRKLGQEAATQLIIYIQPSEVLPIEPVSETEIQETELEEKELEAKEENNQHPQIVDSSNPVAIAQWQQNLEEAIEETLKKVSQTTNIFIQKTGILPQKLPEPILVAAAAAASSQSSSDLIPSPPNILNLVIEISDEEDSEDSNLTQIMAIHLRLGEIEFADREVLARRKIIRNILLQLHKLGQEYKKRQKELKIAEAEAAWRASWFEE